MLNLLNLGKQLRKIGVWQVFLVVMALPTLLALLGVLSSFLHPDIESLSHLAQYVLPQTIKNTIFLVVGVGVVTTTLGVSLAWLTAVCDFPLRKFFVWALILPMAIPGYVMAFALVGLFEYTGPVQHFLRETFGSSSAFPDIYSYGGVVMALSLALYPYTYLMVRNAFQTQGLRSLEVGQSLGLSIRESFWRICLPMARPWIVGGTLLVMMETLSDFGTVAIFNYDTLTSAIYKTWFGLYSLPAALQVASVLLIFVVVITLLERRSRASQRFSQTRSAKSVAGRIRLSGVDRWLALLVCVLVFSLAFVMPVMRLLYWAVPNMNADITSQFLGYVAGSTSLSLIAMLMIAGLALLMAFTARTYNSPFAKIVVRISTMGYALPGTVLAVGLFVPVAAIDNVLGAMGLSTPLLQGTMVVMLLAYSVRFMAVAFTPLESNLLRITPSIDAASRSLGVSGIKMLAKVHLPMVKGGLLTAMVLVFVDVMKELPITLMTRPFGFNTLAVRIFELSSEGLWERAALPALAIVLVGLIPAFILIRKSDAR
ncbi:MAG TPA: ABC transporter permease [Cellvibrionales bacterium]|nr:iron ABC transporter permease [Pseudomonadales bacterium]HAB56325.1 ABC transporter permease [Cellvibrionales bacterium]HAW13584.1 ABC transporter permease [Cellvibrionales bacterium]HCX27397.1 ABC transporter permease [Cellvibrionales bacterium]